MRALATSGSSPRMRGKPSRSAPDRPTVRIIPAHAGQTGSPPAMPSSCADHPRACGANALIALTDTGSRGSSPRMRGKRTWSSSPHGCRRIIPAHAGQTRMVTPGARSSRDHPRACGANDGLTLSGVAVPGSSPRMRGKQSDSISKTHSDNTRKIRFAQSVTLR